MIELKNLCAGYGENEVLHGVSLELSPGQLTVIVGPNGSGKSTLLKAVSGFIAPSSGEILLDGTATDGLLQREAAQKIAYLSQQRAVADMTVEQLVLHGRFPHLRYPRRYTAADREIARDAMQRMKVLQYAERPLTTLSGGMRQNAYIAMALTQDTPYILLDEPTTYLDVFHRLSLMKTLRSLADEGRGIAAVMHDLPLAFTCADRVAVLHQGHIVTADTPQAVCDSGIIGQLMGVELVCSQPDGDYHYRYGRPLKEINEDMISTLTTDTEGFQ